MIGLSTSLDSMIVLYLFDAEEKLVISEPGAFWMIFKRGPFQGRSFVAAMDTLVTGLLIFYQRSFVFTAPL